jgi:hypothetical protein
MISVLLAARFLVIVVLLAGAALVLWSAIARAD